MNGPKRLRPWLGLSTIEIVVVCGIVLLLATLAMTGISAARESARRTMCLGRMRQIGIALNSYHEACGRYPSLGHSGQRGSDQRSAFPALLPHLGENALYDSIDFSNSPYDGNTFTQTDGFNATAKATVVASFLCPSDSDRFSFRANANFAFSTGVAATGRHDGAFTLKRHVAAKQIGDGLSHTVGFGEIRRGSGDPKSFDANVDFWYGELAGDYSAFSPDEMLAACGAMRPSLESYSFRGYSWYNGGYENTQYNHVAGPNANGADCSAHGSNIGMPAVAGSFASRSAHSGGVNVGMMDGAARWVANGVDIAIWRAIATRKGGETTTDN